MTPMIKLTRPPARIGHPGTFPVPGMDNAVFTIGREAVADQVPMLCGYSGNDGHLSVDTESAGKDGRARYDMKAVIISTLDHAVIFDPRDLAQFEMIRTVTSSGHWLDYHNSPHDVPIMYATGLIDMDAVKRTYDTLITARQAEPDSMVKKGLAACNARYLGGSAADALTPILKNLSISREAWYRDFDLDTPVYRLMAATDGIVTARIRRPVHRAALARLTTGHPYPKYGVAGADAEAVLEREQQNNRTTLPRTCLGVRVDPDYLDAYRRDNDARIGELAMAVEREGIRPGVSADMAKWLDGRDLLPEHYPRTAKTKQPSGSKDDLAKVRHPLVDTFLEHKSLTHDEMYLSKVMDAADDNGRIHCQVNHLTAVTGRMSVSGDFPYQQTPEQARAVLLADPGDRLVSIDWSQIEPVWISYLAGDANALDAYEAGSKFYQAVADTAHVPYKTAKVIVLGSLYGQGVGKLAGSLGCSVAQAQALQAQIWTALPRVAALARRGGKLRNLAVRYRKIFTLSGRILPIPAGMWPCWERHDPDNAEEISRCRQCNDRGLRWGVMEHMGVNYPTQGGAYDLLADAVAEIGRRGLGDAIYFLMHDELVVSADAAHDIRKIMETPPERMVWLAQQALPGRVPLLRTDMEACVGESWQMPPEPMAA